MRFPCIQCVLWVCSYHREKSLGLLEERFRKQGDVDTLRDGHRAAVQVSNDHVQLRTKPTWGNTYYLLLSLLLITVIQNVITASERQTQTVRVKSALPTTTTPHTFRLVEMLPRRWPLTLNPNNCSCTDNWQVTTVQNAASDCDAVAKGGSRSVFDLNHCFVFIWNILLTVTEPCQSSWEYTAGKCITSNYPTSHIHTFVSHRWKQAAGEWFLQ